MQGNPRRPDAGITPRESINMSMHKDVYHEKFDAGPSMRLREAQQRAAMAEKTARYENSIQSAEGPLSPLAAELRALELRMEQIHQTIGLLGERIMPILKPDQPEPGGIGSQTSEVRERQSDTVEQVRSITLHAVILEETLAAILRRVEV